MSDESGTEERGGTSHDGSVAWAALGAASRAKADAFLDEQIKVLRLQKIRLEKEDEIIGAQVRLDLTHLRFRRVADYAQAALAISIAIVVVLVVLGLGLLVWNAAQDNDLVVDTFSVPPDIAQSGLTGTVLAGRVLDKFGAMQQVHMSTTQDVGAYHASDTTQIHVEIPQTGVSIGELNDALRAWLGHETHVAGDLVRTKAGYALTVRIGSQPGKSIEGGDLDLLTQEAAENVFEAVRPLRFAEYLARVGRETESETVILPYVRSGSEHDRAMAYADLALLAQNHDDAAAELRDGREATRLDPQNPTALGWLESAEQDLEHEEDALHDAIAVIPLWRGGEAAGLEPDLVAGGPYAFGAFRDEFKGDFQQALAGFDHAAAVEPEWDSSYSRAIDSARDHDLAKARLFGATIPAGSEGNASELPAIAQFFIAAAAGDWRAAEDWGEKADLLMRGDPTRAEELRRFLRPWLAWTLAHNHAFAKADAMIEATPPDCDICIEMRGNVAGAEKDWARAEAWFGMASARTPSIPFADYYWGLTLLRKGDTDAAIAKFKSANEKGPHFADPLVMWGEALMQENRSDLALAKFAEAAKYAPTWGRLHLKWGEALWYGGNKDDAKKEFAAAAGLDLSTADKAALEKWTSRNG